MEVRFDNRENAARHLAEQGSVNYQGYFVEERGDGQFTANLFRPSLAGNFVKTAASSDEVFEFLDKLRSGELGYLTRGLDRNLEIRRRDQPLLWMPYERYAAVADDGVGLYYITRHTSFEFCTGYTVHYCTGFRGEFVLFHGHCSYSGKIEPFESDYCPYRFKTVGVAKAACERHFSQGDWGAAPTPARSGPHFWRWALVWSFLISFLLMLVALFQRHRVTGTWE